MLSAIKQSRHRHISIFPIIISLTVFHSLKKRQEVKNGTKSTFGDPWYQYSKNGIKSRGEFQGRTGLSLGKWSENWSCYWRYEQHLLTNICCITLCSKHIHVAHEYRHCLKTLCVVSWAHTPKEYIHNIYPQLYIVPRCTSNQRLHRRPQQSHPKTFQAERNKYDQGKHSLSVCYLIPGPYQIWPFFTMPSVSTTPPLSIQPFFSISVPYIYIYNLLHLHTYVHINTT